MKLATPAVTFRASGVQLRAAPAVPVPDVMLSVTVLLESLVTISPAESSTATTGWVVKAVAAAAPRGEVVKTIWLAAKTLKRKLVADVSVPSVAVRVYRVPAVLMAQPAKFATPAVAGSVRPPVQESVAPAVPVPAVMASVTLLVSVVTTLPLVSSTETTGWMVKAEPIAPSLGEVLKTS